MIILRFRNYNKKAISLLSLTAGLYFHLGFHQTEDGEKRLRMIESVSTNISEAISITDAGLFDKCGLRIVYVNGAFTVCIVGIE